MPKLACLAFFRCASSTLLGRDLFDRHVPYLGGCGSVDILSAPKRFDHVFIATKVGHDAQLYLRVVSREEQTPLFRDKALANFLAVIVSDWDVLQVRVA